MDWPHQVHGVLVTTGEDPFGADIARIHQLLGREQVVRRQIGLNGVERLVILLRRRSRGDLRNQVGQVILTPFGQVDLVPDPLSGALAPVAHIAVVGGAQPLPHRRPLLHRWQLLEPVHPLLRRLLHRCQQVEAVVSDAPAQGLALRLLFRQAIVLHPVSIPLIPLIPLGSDLLLEPVWRHGRAAR
jgi:hypothetical protein